MKFFSKLSTVVPSKYGHNLWQFMIPHLGWRPICLWCCYFTTCFWLGGFKSYWIVMAEVILEVTENLTKRIGLRMLMFPGVGWKHLQWWSMTSISLHCGQIVADQNAKPIACTSDLNMHWTYESRYIWNQLLKIIEAQRTPVLPHIWSYFCFQSNCTLAL